MRTAYLSLLSLIICTSTVFSQTNTKSAILFGINHTLIENNQVFNLSAGLGRSDNESYLDIENKLGLRLGFQKSKTLGPIIINLNANFISESFDIKNIRKSTVIMGQTISNTTATVTSRTYGMNFNLNLAIPILKEKLDFFTGISLNSLSFSGGQEQKTKTTFFSTDTPLLVPLNPVIIETTVLKSPKPTQAGITTGLSYSLNIKTKLNLDYVYGISNSIYPFQINRVNLYISRSIGK